VKTVAASDGIGTVMAASDRTRANTGFFMEGAHARGAWGGGQLSD
jgi:hypothetical protein